MIASAAVTHIGWPLIAARRPKPAKECACPARKKKFSKMPHARLKRRTKTMTEEQEWTS